MKKIGGLGASKGVGVKYGYKIVREMGDGQLTSCLTHSMSAKSTIYEQNKWVYRQTCTKGAYGPLAVFTDLGAAHSFIYWAGLAGRRVFCCKYKPSRAKHLWLYVEDSKGGQRIARSLDILRLPHGTALADAVMITEEAKSA